MSHSIYKYVSRLNDYSSYKLLAAAGLYKARQAIELLKYRKLKNIHDLPEIFHHWSNTYLRPLLNEHGLDQPHDFFCFETEKVALGLGKEPCHCVSLGAGNCETEVLVAGYLLSKGIHNFRLECLDINLRMLERGQELAQRGGVNDYLLFTQADVNECAMPVAHVYMVNQALHHFVGLESILQGIRTNMQPGGRFLIFDTIGRNGHMRWPEAEREIQAIWKRMPDRYKYSHPRRRFRPEYVNHDCSRRGGFEGIRAQDILPLLMETFEFEFFLAYANLALVFVERSFGHNFDINNPEDLAFVEEIQRLDQNLIEKGEIKPTQMFATLCKDKPKNLRFYKHLTPEFCVRRPD